jgi:ATP adenylyltransferase
MDTLWAPWRIDYILGEDKEPGCIFCNKPSSDNDEENLIAHRAEGAYTIMNKFPYANGHVLVCPYRHVSDICDLDDEENGLVFKEVRRALAVIRQVMNPDGFNVGLNLGDTAGAGVEEHLHYHIVPRWAGDVNFITVMDDVRVIPEHIRVTRAKLKERFDSMFPD